MDENTLRRATRVVLGSNLIVAGVGHLSFARRGFQAQVPDWTVDRFPWDKDDVVLASGVVEIALGSSIAFAPKSRRRLVGVIAALFFVAIFPGNLAQFTGRRDGLGLDTDLRRLVRLFFQPLMVAVAWWATRDGD